MEALTPTAITLAAADMFNALSRAHNAQIDAFTAEGYSRDQAILASYLALRVMFERFEGPAKGAVSQGWETIEAIAQAMHSQIQNSEATQPEAKA